MSPQTTVTLEAIEWQFLVTTLQGTTAILKSLSAVRDALPGGLQLPITTEMIVNITALAERIESQVTISQ
jgi:hypothetical protein